MLRLTSDQNQAQSNIVTAYPYIHSPNNWEKHTFIFMVKKCFSIADIVAILATKWRGGRAVMPTDTDMHQ